MIPLKTINQAFTKQTSDLISALTWKTHKTNKIILLTNSISVDTLKPLIGFIDNDTFIVARSRLIYKILLPVVTIQGKFHSDKGKSELKLQYKPSILTTIFLAFIAYATIAILIDSFRIEMDLETFINLLIWLILFPIGGLVLAIREGNITKDIVLDFLNAADK